MWEAATSGRYDVPVMRSLPRSVLALVILVAGCGPADPAPAKDPAKPAPPPAVVSRWKVVGVHDGDTVRCLDADNVQHKVRLVGIDAPETGQAFGTKSREHLAALVMGRMVAVERHGEDRYGRTLGRIDADGRNVNREMVASGMAWHYARYDRDPLLAEAEGEARAAKRGLWADPHAVPPWEWRADERKHKRKPATR